MLKQFREHYDKLKLSGWCGEFEHFDSYWSAKKESGGRNIPKQRERFNRINELLGPEEAEAEFAMEASKLANSSKLATSTAKPDSV